MTQGQKTPLLPEHLDPDPLRQLALWLDDAERAELPQPNAMTLATANHQGEPTARIVLLRGIDARGLVFYTNRESRKGRDLLENPQAALVFCWLPLCRQVRVEGSVELVDERESDLYFANRPRGHQIEAHASPQSRVIRDRSYLDEQFQAFSRQFAGQLVPRPAHWGGYRLLPTVLEFWQEGEHRLHDRLRYRRADDGHWLMERLAP